MTDSNSSSKNTNMTNNSFSSKDINMSGIRRLSPKPLRGNIFAEHGTDSHRPSRSRDRGSTNRNRQPRSRSRSRSPGRPRSIYHDREDNPQTYPCPSDDCSVILKTEREFHRHMLVFHYNCGYCSNKSSSTIEQLGHTLIHLGLETLHCVICQTSCQNGRIASDHRNIHSSRISARLGHYNHCSLCRAKVSDNDSSSTRLALQNSITAEFLSHAHVRRRANRSPIPVIDDAANRGISTRQFVLAQKNPCPADILDVPENEPNQPSNDPVARTLADEIESGSPTNQLLQIPGAETSTQVEVDFTQALAQLSITDDAQPTEDEIKDALARLELHD